MRETRKRIKALPVGHFSRVHPGHFCQALKLGHGGDSKIAEFLGIDSHTVARGRRELFGEAVQRQRVRKKGGGRKAVEKKRLK
jgi:hypothetical protein